MTERELTEQEKKIIEGLRTVVKAGAGNVEIKVQDSRIISWSYHPQFQLRRGK